MGTLLSQCPNCGARIRSEKAKFCEYCGAGLPREPESSGVSQAAERFEALRAHPDFEEAMAHRPSMTGEIVSNGLSSAFAIVFVFLAILVAGVFHSVSAGFGKVDGGPFGAIGGMFSFAFSLIPVVVVVVGMVIAWKSISRTKRLTTSPLRRQPALIVDERTRLWGGGRNTRTHTLYYLTLEFENGEREELAVRGSIAGMVAPGDIGVAFLKGDTMLDFTRLRV